MARLPAALVLVLGLPSLAAPAVAAEEPIGIPAPRAGDEWIATVAGLEFELEATSIGTAIDRRGREREALIVDVDGDHPIGFEGKQVMRHTLAVDAASGVAIADVVEWEFAGDSEPATYSSFEPNNPDGWPGWILGGGMLAGRKLAPGDVVNVPLVMTSTRGAESLELSIQSAPSGGQLGRCVRAVGDIHYPTWLTWVEGRDVRRTLDVDVDTVVCEGSPYARTVDLAFRSGENSWSAHTEITEVVRGTGTAIVSGEHGEPLRHGAASFARFEGSLIDGGGLPVWSLEEAQEAASAAPGLTAWRTIHPDGYLVEAAYTAPEQETGAVAGVGAAEWRLVYASPSGAQHRVRAQRRLDVVAALDDPTADAYPVTVPPLSGSDVLTPAGAIAAWRLHAGAGATPISMRWQPLLNDRWYVVGMVRAQCGPSGCQGTVQMEMPFRSDTGAPETGEYPLTLR